MWREALGVALSLCRRRVDLFMRILIFRSLKTNTRLHVEYIWTATRARYYYCYFAHYKHDAKKLRAVMHEKRGQLCVKVLGWEDRASVHMYIHSSRGEQGGRGYSVRCVPPGKLCRCLAMPA